MINETNTEKKEIARVEFGTRKDGVNLFKYFDAIFKGYDANGKPIYEKSGYKILQVQTNILYDDAIDIESAPYVYVQSNEPIEVVKEEENSILENN